MRLCRQLAKLGLVKWSEHRDDKVSVTSNQAFWGGFFSMLRILRSVVPRNRRSKFVQMSALVEDNGRADITSR